MTFLSYETDVNQLQLPKKNLQLDIRKGIFSKWERGLGLDHVQRSKTAPNYWDEAGKNAIAPAKMTKLIDCDFKWVIQSYSMKSTP